MKNPRMRERVMHAFLGPVVAAALLASPADATAAEQDGTPLPPGPLGNALVQFDFATSGSSLEVTAVTNLVLDMPTGRAMPMEAGAGGWTLGLIMDDGFVGVNSPNNEWIEFQMDGTLNWNTKVWPAGSPPASLALSLDTIQEDVGGLSLPNVVATWSGSVTITESGTPYPFRVITDWTVVAGKPFAETRIDVDFDPNATTPDLPFYLSYVIYPTMHVSSLNSPSTPNDALVVPYLSGSLVTHPTNDDVVNGQRLFPFPRALGFGNNPFSVRVSGYYDGAAESNCFFYAANDCDDYWKELWLGTGPFLAANQCTNIGSTSEPPAANGRSPQNGAADGSPGRYVTFRFQHCPEDVYASTRYVMPYRVRMGAIEGDWWELADAYRDLMSEKAVPWYQGPVGSAGNPMPSEAKDLVGLLNFQPGHLGDNIDHLRRQVYEVARVLGPDVTSLWYQVNAPDTFAHWYYGDGTPQNTGYLPGRPSLVSALGKAQEQFGHVVAPYYASSGAADCSDPFLDGDCFGELSDVLAALLLREDKASFHIPGLSKTVPPRQSFICPGASWWQTEMPDRVAEIAGYTGMGGVYLDYFLTDACYATDHHHALPGDPAGGPGGGNWMHTTRMRQVRDFQDQLPSDLLVVMEHAIGRFAEEVHVMQLDPAAVLLAAEAYSQIDCNAPPIPRPMANAATIPFFQAIFDNVKLSTVKVSFPKWPDRRAWTDATLVFTFGQVPGVLRSFIEEIELFSQRGRYGPYFDFLGNMAQALRDEGLLTWHNGTLRRLPGYTVTANAFTNDPGTAVPGIELEPYLDCLTRPEGPFAPTYQQQSPVYTEERTGCNEFTPETFLVPGMFQAPDDAPGTQTIGPDSWADAGSLAFVLANPWVDPFNQGTIDLADISFDPGRYPGWTAQSVYCVDEYRFGSSVSITTSQRGALTFAPDSGTLQPGEIVWWIFRKQL